MNKNLNHLFKTGIAFLLVTFLFSCAGSKSYYKKGTQLEQAGLEDEAAEYYYIALQKNRNNVEAQIGLKNNAEKVLENKLTEFYKAHGTDNFKAAYYAYTDLEAYKQRMGRFVRLSIPPYYEEYFVESKKNYLEALYNQAQEFIQNEKYELAEINLQEISKIDPNYEDVKTLKKLSEAEPLYQEAIALFEANKYKEAYKNFEQVIKIKGAYKEALQYKDKCLKQLQLSIAVLPIESANPNFNNEIAEKYYGKIVSEVLSKNNPFIKVIDRVNLEKIIAEQKLALSGLVDQSTAAKAGLLMGANIVVTGKVLDMQIKEGIIKKELKKGYQAFSERKYNPIGKYYYFATVYKKVEYEEYFGESVVSTSFQVQMISAETGEVLLSEVFTKERTDKVHYATYEGDHRHLYPGTWKSKSFDSAEDQVYSSVSQKQQLDRLLQSRDRNLRSVQTIKLDIIEEIAGAIAYKIQVYEYNRQ